MRALSLALRRLPVAGRGRIIRRLGVAYVSDGSPWPSHATVSRSAGGTIVPVDLADYADRVFYLTGRSTQLGVESALARVLRPGDTYVDVGANNGFTVAYALDRVGRSGTVIAIEPNPECCRRLEMIRSLNRLENLHILPVALGSHPGTAELRLPGGRSGHGTLAQTTDAVTARVCVETGDAALPHLISDTDPQLRCIKLDVEGWEPQAVMGMADVLEKHRPFVIAEHEPSLLRRAGNPPSALIEQMTRFGYAAARIVRVARFPYRIAFEDVAEAPIGCDLFFSPTHLEN